MNLLLSSSQLLTGLLNIYYDSHFSEYFIVYFFFRNLEKAINYYFDYQSSSKVPQMTLLPSEMANGAFRILPPNTK